MNFDSLEYFTVLARERNFTRAAEALHITQQSLSSHIAALEKELNCPLVVRHVPLELTYAGQTFLRYAEAMRRTRHAMQQEFFDISQNQKGELRIGVSFTRGRAIMPELIVAFQKQYPQMAVTLTEAANDTLQTLLLNGDIDLEIAEFHKAPQEIALQDFYDEHIVLCFSDALLERCGIDFDAEEPRMRKGDLTALQSCPFVMGRADDINGRIGRALLSKGGVKPTVKAMSGNIETLLALCEEGVGACFSPENLVHTALGREQASKLHLLRFEQGGVYPIRFGYLKRSYQWSIVEAFIRMARESLQE